MKRRLTRQVATIYDALAASRDHPTAEQLFQRVRQVLPQVSLGTVYRNLDKLRVQGLLRVVRLEGGQAHFDAMMDPHDHFVCERCGALIDVPSQDLTSGHRAARDAGHHVQWATTALYGTCNRCAAGASAAGAQAE